MARNVNFMALADMIENLDSLVDKGGNIRRDDPLYKELRQILYWNLMNDEAREGYQDFAAGLHQQGENVELDIAGAYDVAKQEGWVDSDAEDDAFAGLLSEDEYNQMMQLLESDAGYKKNGWNGRRYYEMALEDGDKRSGNKKRLLLARLFREILAEGKKKPAAQTATKRVLRGKLVDF